MNFKKFYKEYTSFSKSQKSVETNFEKVVQLISIAVIIGIFFLDYYKVYTYIYIFESQDFLSLFIISLFKSFFLICNIIRPIFNIICVLHFVKKNEFDLIVCIYIILNILKLLSIFFGSIYFIYITEKKISFLELDMKRLNKNFEGLENHINEYKKEYFGIMQGLKKK